MSDEKPNNDFHWKNKLEDLESFPGETFNKDAAWEKLHERIQAKSRSRKAIGYWLAAACLLLALITPWLFLANKNEKVLVKNNSVPKQTQSIPAHLLQPGRKKTPDVISIVSTEKKLSSLPAEKSNKINAVLKRNIIPFKPIQDKKEKEEFIAQKIINNAIAPVETTINIVATLPEKKRLDVVHINEIGDPVEETPNTARNYEHHSFKVKFINQELNTNPPSSGNTGFNIFKTKTLPSN